MLFIVLAVGALAEIWVHTSMRFDLAFVIAEVSVAGVLLILIIVKGGDHGQVPKLILPTHSPSGFGGLGEAFVFIVLAFFGFESSTTVAEEVRNWRRNLPIALIGSVVLTGLWFSFAMYSIIVGYGARHVSQISSATAPLHDLAQRYIGGWYANLVNLAAVSAIIAVLLAIHTANFRVIYALGRDGALPRLLGRTHPRQRPHMAIIAYSIFTLVIGLAAGIAWGPLPAFGDLGYLSSLAILPVYIGANVALPFFIYHRYRSEFSIVVHVIFPAVSSVIFLLAIWLSLHPYPGDRAHQHLPAPARPVRHSRDHHRGRAAQAQLARTGQASAACCSWRRRPCPRLRTWPGPPPGRSARWARADSRFVKLLRRIAAHSWWRRAMLGAEAEQHWRKGRRWAS